MNEYDELQSELAASIRFEVPENATVLGTGTEFLVSWWV